MVVSDDVGGGSEACYESWMDFTRILLRMSHLVRHPPSKQQVIVVCVVAIIATALISIERFVGWPEWLTVDRMPSARNPLY